MAELNTYISMLRGINVSGQKLIKMSELQAMYESLRLTHVSTYIQSGNVIFQSKSDNPLSLGDSIQKAIEKSFGFSVSVVLRRPTDFRSVIKKCPFTGGTTNDERKIYVTFLKSRPAPASIRIATQAAKKSADLFRLVGDEIYLYCHDGYGKTALSNTFFEKKLNVAATTRNWNTVQTLLAMSTELDQSDS